MNIEDAKAKGIFRTRIKLREAWETDPEQVDPADEPLKELYKDEWILMREPTQTESMRMDEKDLKGINEIAPGCVEDSSFKHGNDGTPCSGREVWDLVRSSLTLYRYVTEKWIKSTPLARRSDGESAKSPSSSATADASQPAT